MKQITLFISLFLFTLGSFAQDLKITEIMYNPSGGDNPWEWIEVYNSGDTAIDLSGYVLDDASGTALSEANISNGILQPLESAILFDADDITENQFREVWGTVNLIGVSKWSTLGNTGDTIGIWDSFLNYDDDQRTQLNTVAHVVYDNTDNGWPNDDGKASIFLIALEFDTAIGENWSLSSDGGETPVNTGYISNELHDNSGSDVGSPGVPAGVEDIEKPIVSCPEDMTMSLQEGSCEISFPIELPTGTDNSEDALSFEGIRSDDLDLISPYPVGETTITWTAIDAAGNISEPCIQKISIVDEVAPTISCPENIEAISADGIPVIVAIENATATDSCAGQIDIIGLRSDAEILEATYPVGETTILWQATDAAGNTTECVQMITVALTPSSENAIVSFAIENQIGESVIDATNNNITILVPLGTDVTALTPIIAFSEFAAMSPESGELVDFSMPITYTIIAQDGSVQEWLVTLNVEADSTPPTFEVNGNSSDFMTTLELDEVYAVGLITNIIDESATTTEITGDNLVDTSQEGGAFLVVYVVSDGINTTTITETVMVSESEDEIADFQVLSFTLINADTNQDLFTITEGMQIDVNTLPTLHLDIRANTTTDVESVRFSLDGTLSTSRTESLLPYALFQDLPIGNYMGNDFTVGMYKVEAIPYTEDSLRGTAGTPFSINFELTDSCQNFELSLGVITDILTCEGADGAIIVATIGGVAPINYSWSHNPLIDSPMATDLVAGEYSVTATDANNCNTELRFTLKDPGLPEVSLLPFESVLDSEEPIVLFEGQPFGGTYSGVGVTEGEFDPSVGAGIYEITYTYFDEASGCNNTATGEIEVLPSVGLAVESFTLVNADTNEDIFDLIEGMKIDINSLPTLHLDIRANTSEEVESVKLYISGAITSARTESLTPYALFQDLPIGDYKGNDFVLGTYAVAATPYDENSARGNSGSSFEINFELVDPTLSVTEFMLVNAETNEDLFLIEEGMRIDVSDLPTLHLDIRAITTADVESVRLSLAGAITTERTESLVPYALFQDLPIGDYKGSDFVLGAYTVKAVPYSEDALRGNQGNALTVNFELVDSGLSGKQVNQMIITPNPANSETILSFTSPVTVKTIVIYDMQGRLIRKYGGQKVKDQEVYLLEIKALQSGNYFIKTVDIDGNKLQGQLLVKKR